MSILFLKQFGSKSQLLLMVQDRGLSILVRQKMLSNMDSAQWSGQILVKR